MTEVGDIDRRTLRQMRDRFRTAFTLDLADLGWVVAHKLVRKHAPSRSRAGWRACTSTTAQPAAS